MTTKVHQCRISCVIAFEKIRVFRINRVLSTVAVNIWMRWKRGHVQVTIQSQLHLKIFNQLSVTLHGIYLMKIFTRRNKSQRFLTCNRVIHSRYLSDENIYKKEQITEVFNLQPSDSFLAAVNKLLSKFKLKKNQDKLLQEFNGFSNADWKEYFHPCSDPKVVFLMLIHLLRN